MCNLSIEIDHFMVQISNMQLTPSLRTVERSVNRQKFLNAMRLLIMVSLQKGIHISREDLVKWSRNVRRHLETELITIYYTTIHGPPYPMDDLVEGRERAHLLWRLCPAKRALRGCMSKEDMKKYVKKTFRFALRGGKEALGEV